MNYKDWDKEQLVKHIYEMNQELLRLQGSLDESGWVETCLKERTRVLNERVKELNCIYEAVRVFRDNKLSPAEKTRTIILSLPAAWKYSNLAGARAEIGGAAEQTPGYADADLRLTAAITPRDLKPGTLTVCYAKPPAGDKDPFLGEERNLILVLAEILGAVWDAPKSGRL